MQHSVCVVNSLLVNVPTCVCTADRSRPYLMTRVPGTNDYVNAAFIDVCGVHVLLVVLHIMYVCITACCTYCNVCVQGYKCKSEYIITQMPLPHTVIDLWRLVYEHGVGTLVMLNPWDPDDEVSNAC